MSIVPDPAQNRPDGRSSDADAPTRTYPLSDPIDDHRFTFGLMIDIGRVLVDHGYPALIAGGDLVDLQQVMFSFLHRTDQHMVHAWNADYRNGYAEGYLDAVQQKTVASTGTRAAVASVAARRDALTDIERVAIEAALKPPAWGHSYGSIWVGPATECGASCTCGTTFDGFDTIGEATELLDGHIAYPHLPACPDWCVRDHSDDLSTPVDNLVLHEADDQVDGTTRRLLDADTLDIRVARTDCPEEGRKGAPTLHVHVDADLTTWEQAAELARAILDGFGYLHGADRDLSSTVDLAGEQS